ncbi:hypothetical protein BN946_scf184452.g1 [Trametes cinnabarina]|uniref:Uncharacterized protein n=1 Tax=Pycnoporus cinnabarinus TaxID=5643 RepID=A0A060SV08_PYCCI|nr:hypothetical protein BN946_scf184452.g1 [Trametes cinnabarina]
MKYFSAILASLAVLASGVSAASLGSVVCADEVVADTTHIGANKDVKVTYSHCGVTPLVTAQGKEVSSLHKRQSNATNVCGAPCNTFCFTPSGGGPNEGDCTVIADALLYDSQNVGALSCTNHDWHLDRGHHTISAPGWAGSQALEANRAAAYARVITITSAIMHT